MHSRTSITLHFRAESYDYPTGKVDAGTVMNWIDKAGYATAASWTGTNVTAAYVGNMHFTRPVPVETPVQVQSRLLYTGRTTVHVQARLLLPAILDDMGDPTVATEVVLIYRSVDENDNVLTVRPWEPRTEAGRLRQTTRQERSAEMRAMENDLMHVQIPEPHETSAAIVTLRFVANSPDSSAGDKISAGLLLRSFDEAANVCAARWAKRNVVSVFAGGVRVEEPVRAGQILEIEARLVHTSTRSMQILQRAWVYPTPWADKIRVGHGLTVAVTTSPDGERADPVPQWEPETATEKELEELCSRLVSFRNQISYSWDVPTSDISPAR